LFSFKSKIGKNSTYILSDHNQILAYNVADQNFISMISPVSTKTPK